MKIVSKVLDHLNVWIHFFNMLRTKCDNYIFFIFRLIMVREKHFLVEVRENISIL